MVIKTWPVKRYYSICRGHPAGWHNGGKISSHYKRFFFKFRWTLWQNICQEKRNWRNVPDEVLKIMWHKRLSVGNHWTNLFQKTNNLGPSYKYTMWPNLVLSWDDEEKNVCCSAETSIYSTVHQYCPCPVASDHPPTVLKHSQETVIKPFPQVTQNQTC